MRNKDGCKALGARTLPLYGGICLLVLTAWSVSALGQFGGLNAEFAGGGARALSMGGAFIALGDDATAVEFNPAGLWQLRTPEIAAQVIYTEERREQALSGRAFRTLEPEFQKNTESYFIPSFLSGVYPTQHLVIGLSEFTNIYYDRTYRDALLRDDDTYADYDIREQAANYAFGLTLATGLTKNLSLGATVRYNVFRYELSGGTPGYGGQFEDEALSANAGLIWKLNRHFRLGLVYKSPQELKGSYEGLPVDTELPDTIGLGVAFLPNDRWRLLADVDVVRWSKFDPNPNDDFVKDDVWRVHFGTEWYAGRWRGTGYFLRGGYAFEESNAFRYTGEDPLLSGLVPDPEPSHHWSFGVGLSRPGFQVDVGLDVTNEGSLDLILSTVLYL